MLEGIGIWTYGLGVAIEGPGIGLEGWGVGLGIGLKILALITSLAAVWH